MLPCNDGLCRRHTWGCSHPIVISSSIFSQSLTGASSDNRFSSACFRFARNSSSMHFASTSCRARALSVSFSILGDHLQHLYFGIVFIIIEIYYASNDDVPNLAAQAAGPSAVVLTPSVTNPSQKSVLLDTEESLLLSPHRGRDVCNKPLEAPARFRQQKVVRIHRAFHVILP